jgi:hypothetical protein
MWSHGWSRYWVHDFNGRTKDIALSRWHNNLVSWAMFGHDLEHEIKWKVIYMPQDILIKHDEIQGWPRLRAKIGFKLVNIWYIHNVPHGIIWSRGMVRFFNYALWSNPWYMCICVFLCVLGIFLGHASNVISHIIHERMPSSRYRHQGWKEKVQDDEHL